MRTPRQQRTSFWALGLVGCALLLLSSAGSSGATLNLQIQVGDFYGDGTPTWAVFGTLADDGTHNGLGAVWVDIVGSGGVTVLDSWSMLPTGEEKWATMPKAQYRFFGFSFLVQHGALGPGLGVGASQDFAAVTGTNPDTAVLRNVGNAAGSKVDGRTSDLIEWDKPVMIAVGSYSGTTGTLTVSGSASTGASVANVINPGWMYGQAGPTSSIPIQGDEIILGAANNPPVITGNGGPYEEGQWEGPEKWNDPDRLIHLIATASDPDGDPLTYLWSIAAPGSTNYAPLKEGTQADMVVTIADIIAALPGVDLPLPYPAGTTPGPEYYFPLRLVVNDGQLNSAPSDTNLFIPEPTTIVLLGLGGLAGLIRRRRRA